MTGFSVNTDVCVGDGLCIAACGRRALTDDGQGRPVLPEENVALCNACGHCSAICPVGAVTSPGYGGAPAEEPGAGAVIEYADARKFILSCRSMRRYRPEEVDRQTIEELLDVARRAPTASNRQELRWMVMGREKATEFTRLTMQWFDTVVRLDPDMSARYSIDNMMMRYKAGDDPILRGAPNAVICLADASEGWATVDGAIATTYFCLAAHARGVGSCWCGFGVTAVKTYQPLRDLLGLTDTETAPAIAFFGYPAIRYPSLPPRKPLNVKWL